MVGFQAANNVGDWIKFGVGGVGGGYVGKKNMGSLRSRRNKLNIETISFRLIRELAIEKHSTAQTS